MVWRTVFVLLIQGMLSAAPAAADYAAGVRHWGRGDFAAAAREFLPAARNGDSEAQFMLGRLYAMGYGVPQDFVRAWVWHDRAARQGHILAGQTRDSLDHVLNPQQLAQAHGMAQPPLRPTAAQPVQGRAVLLVPRRGVVAMVPSHPARMVAPGPTTEGRLLAQGDLARQVREVQRGLIRAGYFDGPADGRLRPELRRAIRAYQKDSGLPSTGLLSPRLMERLAAADAQQADLRQSAR